MPIQDPVLVLLDLRPFPAFHPARFAGPFRNAIPHIVVASLVVILCAVGFWLLSPLRKKEIESAPDPAPTHPFYIVGCTTVAGLFLFFMTSMILLVTPPEEGRESGYIILGLFIGLFALVVFYRWLDVYLTTSRNPKTRVRRLFIPELPILLVIGLLMALVIYAEIGKSISKEVTTDTRSAQVIALWGTPLFSDDTIMIYATRRDELIALTLQTSRYIVSTVPYRESFFSHNSNIPCVGKIAKWKTSAGKLEEIQPTNRGRMEDLIDIFYTASGAELRIVGAESASEKCRAEVANLLANEEFQTWRQPEPAPKSEDEQKR